MTPTRMLRFNILVLEERQDLWSAVCAEIPGCMTQARSEPEVIEMIQDAIQANLDLMHERGQNLPSAPVRRTGANRIVLEEVCGNELRAKFAELDDHMYHTGRHYGVLLA